MLAFSLAVLAATIALFATLVRGWRDMRQLGDLPPQLPSPPPAVSIVFSALNEAHTVEPALGSMLALDYPDFEVIAIDDRSTDGTGEILERLARDEPRLSVFRVQTLPAGWLGKNHALWLGAGQAKGDYLLFTDADVHFAPTALARAVAHCEAKRLDHLTVVPQMPMRTPFLQMCMLGGLVGLLMLFRPWRAERSGRHGLGIGAFNLVRAPAYRRVGGHEALATEVLDDIELGRTMAAAGMRQGALAGRGMVTVEMYRSGREMLRGVQKNVFTFLDYSAAKLVAATVVTFSLSIWPWLALLLTSGPTLAANLATVGLTLTAWAYFARQLGYQPAALAYLPLHGLLSLGILWQVALLTWTRGGIVWRGTHYPLALIRKRTDG